MSLLRVEHFPVWFHCHRESDSALGKKGTNTVLVRKEDSTGKQTMCPPAHALLYKKKDNTEATWTGREMRTVEESSQLSQEVSQQEVPEVFRMELSSPGLLSAHVSSNCSMVIGVTTVGCPKTTGENPYITCLQLIWQSSRDRQQAPSLAWHSHQPAGWDGISSAFPRCPFHWVFNEQHFRLKLGNMGSRKHWTPPVVAVSWFAFPQLFQWTVNNTTLLYLVLEPSNEEQHQREASNIFESISGCKRLLDFGD